MFSFLQGSAFALMKTPELAVSAGLRRARRWCVGQYYLSESCQATGWTAQHLCKLSVDHKGAVNLHVRQLLEQSLEKHVVQFPCVLLPWDAHW